MLLTSALYVIDVCVAVCNLTMLTAVAAWSGRGAIRRVVRDGQLRVARPDVGELCIASVPGWRRVDTCLSRGTRPVAGAAPKTDNASVLEVCTVGGDGRVARLLTQLAPSLRPDVSAQSRELATLAAAAVGCQLDDRVTVVYDDFTSETFGPGDTVVAVRAT